MCLAHTAPYTTLKACKTPCLAPVSVVCSDPGAEQGRAQAVRSVAEVWWQAAQAHTGCAARCTGARCVKRLRIPILSGSVSVRHDPVAVGARWPSPVWLCHREVSTVRQATAGERKSTRERPQHASLAEMLEEALTRIVQHRDRPMWSESTSGRPWQFADAARRGVFRATCASTLSATGHAQ
jgi:hypothetical protein